MHSVANRYTSSPEQRRMGGYKGAKPDRNFRIQQRYSASHRCDHFNTVKDQLSLVSINTDTGEVRQHCNKGTLSLCGNVHVHVLYIQYNNIAADFLQERNFLF